MPNPQACELHYLPARLRSCNQHPPGGHEKSAVDKDVAQLVAFISLAKPLNCALDVIIIQVGIRGSWHT